MYFTTTLRLDILIDYKEAMAMAFSGVLRVRNEVNFLSSASGASQDNSSGVVYLSSEN